MALGDGSAALLKAVRQATKPLLKCAPTAVGMARLSHASCRTCRHYDERLVGERAYDRHRDRVALVVHRDESSARSGDNASA